MKKAIEKAKELGYTVSGNENDSFIIETNGAKYYYRRKLTKVAFDSVCLDVKTDEKYDLVDNVGHITMRPKKKDLVVVTVDETVIEKEKDGKISTIGGLFEFTCGDDFLEDSIVDDDPIWGDDRRKKYYTRTTTVFLSPDEMKNIFETGLDIERKLN